jgi:CheY-like chemotaxis protein
MPRDRAHHKGASERQVAMHVEIAEGIRSVLIVEDEGLVAMMMEDLVRELGISDIHICSDVASAVALASTADIDCAVLDLWIRDGSSSEVADTLAARGIPFLFSTGTTADALDHRHANRPVLGKPFTDDDFKRLLLDTWTLGSPERQAVAADEAV